MSNRVKSSGSPRSGTFISFLKMFSSVEPEKRKNIFISPAPDPGTFNYCVFPTPVTLPANCQRFIIAAEAVAEIMDDEAHTLFPLPPR
jgi:hypothetical protein